MTGLRWGLVGASTIAAEHMIDAFRANGGEAVAVMSANADRAAQYATKHGIAKATTDLNALVEDKGRRRGLCLDDQRTPSRPGLRGRRRRQARPMREAAGADPRRRAGDGRRMPKRGVVMGTNHHLRNAATHRAMRDAIKAGRIGKPLFARVFHAVYLPPHLQGWRIEKPNAGGGVILDITVHDADTLRFVLDDEPQSVIAMASHGGMAQASLEDGVMGVIRFSSGLLAQFHDAFTTKYATTGFEVHGDEGSLIGRDCMTQAPKGEVLLRSAAGEEALRLDHEKLYVRSVRLFQDAVEGRGAPSATGEDGVKSLSVAISTLEAARSGAAAPST